MNLFISPSEKVGKITEKEVLAKQLAARWPTAIINEINNPNREFILEWEIPGEEKYLSGKLNQEEDMIVFEFSDIAFGAEFALWAYNNLLIKNKIILYDENYSDVLPMNLIVTTLDVTQAFS